MAIDIALDCRHYLGDRPCTFKCTCRCAHYAPMGFRVLVIKLAALGDVVRTASLLPAIKRRHPVSHVTWVSSPGGVRIMGGHPMIDRLVGFDAEGILTLTQQQYDLVISLDKETGPAALCNAVNCPDKRGVRMSRYGTVEPTDDRCRPYFLLGLDDEVKFHQNTRSYPELIHEAVGLDYVRQPYRLYASPGALARAEAMFAPWKRAARGGMIGLNTGSGRVFSNKAPRREHWLEICRLLAAAGHAVALLGGPDERELNAWLGQQMDGPVHQSGCENTEQQFIAVVRQCDLVICGDTLALHVALSQDVPVVALFGPTCEQEIDLFGLGRKIITSADCSPCYLRNCDRKVTCMDVISAREIAETAEAVLAESRQGAVVQ